MARVVRLIRFQSGWLLAAGAVASGCTSYAESMENYTGNQHLCASVATSEIGRRMANHAMNNCRTVLGYFGYIPKATVGEVGIEELAADLTGALRVVRVAKNSAADGKVRVGSSVLSIDGQLPGNPRYARYLLFGTGNSPVYLRLEHDSNQEVLRLIRRLRQQSAQ